jgi:hypothetical protein
MLAEELPQSLDALPENKKQFIMDLIKTHYPTLWETFTESAIRVIIVGTRLMIRITLPLDQAVILHICQPLESRHYRMMV